MKEGGKMENSGITTAMVRIEGASPLLMHNGQLANPLNEWTMKIKEITSKHHSKKTDADGIELRRLEFHGGLYYDEEKKAPMIPDVFIEGTIRDAARDKKKGPTINAGLSVYPDKIPLIYKGTKDRVALYKDGNFVDNRIIKLDIIELSFFDSFNLFCFPCLAVPGLALPRLA